MSYSLLVKRAGGSICSIHSLTEGCYRKSSSLLQDRRQVSREGPAITSTPAMYSELKYPMIPKGLCENNVPTPIVAPKEIRNIKEVMNINRCSSSDPFIQGGIIVAQEIEFEGALYENNKFPHNSNKHRMEQKQISRCTSPPDHVKNKKIYSESEVKEFEPLDDGSKCVISIQVLNNFVEEVTANLDRNPNENDIENIYKFTNQCDSVSVDEKMKIEYLETNDNCIQKPMTQITDSPETSIQGCVYPSEANQSNRRLGLLNETEITCDSDKAAKSLILNQKCLSKKSSDVILTTNESLKINASYVAGDDATDSVNKISLENLKKISNNMDYNKTTCLESRHDSAIITDEHEYLNSSVGNMVAAISEPLENITEIPITVVINKECLKTVTTPHVDNVPKISETKEKTGINRKSASNCRKVKQLLASHPVKNQLVKGGQLCKVPLTINSASRRTSALPKLPNLILSAKDKQATSRTMQPSYKKKETNFVCQTPTIFNKKGIEFQSLKLKATGSSDSVVNKTSAISVISDSKKKLTTGLKLPMKVATTNPLQTKSVNSISNLPTNSKLKYCGQSSEYNASKVPYSKPNMDKAGSEKPSSSNKENSQSLLPNVRPSGIRRPSSNIPRMKY